MSDKCLGIFGRVFGHSFKDVYEEIEIKSDRSTDFIRECTQDVFCEDLPGVIRALSKTSSSVYVYSVCRRCGKIIERSVK